MVLVVLVKVCLFVFNRCFLGDDCFLINLEVIKFMEILDGILYFFYMVLYDVLVVWREIIYMKFFFVIMEVKNINDV